MKKKSNLALKYVEGIIYCVMLLISVMLSISGNTYIKMIPIAFLSGIIGQVLLGKKAMTSIFTCLLSITLLQVKSPAMLKENIIMTVVIVVLSLVGEICGYSLKKLAHLLKLKNTKRREKERLKHYLLCTITCIIAIFLNSIINGNIISYFRCKNNLRKYFSTEYSSGSRFKIFSSRYSIDNKAKYTFYTKDTLSNEEIGKFIVYLDDTQTIQDEYKSKILNKMINNISNSIESIDKIPSTSITVTYENTQDITLNFIKSVEQISEECVDEYSKQIAEYIQKVKDTKYFENIKQIKIVLECKENSKNSLATFIYMEGYNEMLEQGQEEEHNYIKRALNIEYLY